MAYFTQEMKKNVAAKLKDVVPAGWKYTLSVKDHSTLYFNLKEIPAEYKLAKDLAEVIEQQGYCQLRGTNDVFKSTKHSLIFEKIWEILNDTNYDNSDSQSDYFDVGYYCYVNFGRWNKALIIK